MKAAVYYETGSPDVFRYEDVPDPEPSAGEMLVAVEAVSIKGVDTLNRLGGEMTAVPHIVGYQAAGTVTGLGDGVDGFSVGDRVVTVGLNGSHADKRVALPNFAWHIPGGLSIEEAACIPVPFGTAHDCLFEFGRLQPAETALIHAGAGGVGLAAIQMAKRAGARVLATASSDDRLERLKEFGLDDGINYATKDFVAECRRLTDGRGVDVVVDSVGGATLQGSLNALAYRGRCITVGDASRSSAESRGPHEQPHPRECRCARATAHRPSRCCVWRGSVGRRLRTSTLVRRWGTRSSSHRHGISRRGPPECRCAHEQWRRTRAGARSPRHPPAGP